VTPSYNQARFIEETIRAVLLQGYPDIEYIVCHDGSADHSLDIIGKYADWIRILLGDRNKGMSHAINRGFEVSTGNLITWIASDDVYFSGAFHNVARRWPELREYGAVVGSFCFMNEDSKVDETAHQPRLPNPGPLDLTTLSPQAWRLHQVSTFYVRDALDEVGRFVREDLQHNMDRELIYRIAQKHRILMINEALAAFRIHSRSKSWSVSNIVNMSREYARIQNMFLTDNKNDNVQRRRIAKYRLAKGYIKYAKYEPRTVRSLVALLKAIYHDPGVVFTKGYVVAWLKVLRTLRSIQGVKNLCRLSIKSF
jgi:glycosyltransferase involved in cell wall biosynthesis